VTDGKFPVYSSDNPNDRVQIGWGEMIDGESARIKLFSEFDHLFANPVNNLSIYTEETPKEKN
jgi:hypothetical protein